MNNPIAKFELEPGVFVKVYNEDSPDWSWAEDNETKQKIQSGDIEQVIVFVSVYDESGEVEGTDSLGGIVIGFDDHKQEIRDAIDSNEMVASARQDLETRLNKILSHVSWNKTGGTK